MGNYDYLITTVAPNFTVKLNQFKPPKIEQNGLNMKNKLRGLIVNTVFVRCILKAKHPKTQFIAVQGEGKLMPGKVNDLSCFIACHNSE